ncbi:hypothetical protein U1Q18_002277 [Sarracenia purpurea var. burkii]
MAEFNAQFQNLKPSFSVMNSNMELLNNLSALENLSSNVQGLVGLPNDTNFVDHHHHHNLNHHPHLPTNFTDDAVHSSFHSAGAPFYEPATHFLPSAEGPSKRVVELERISETDHLGMSSRPVSATGSVADTRNKKNPSFGGKKRKRSNEREAEKPREVVHVRAKRGQATDSHSLAERTMGMAVMLDVITNYVRSLQNQIEFLSMKLSAASLYYDFNSEMETAEPMPVLFLSLSTICTNLLVQLGFYLAVLEDVSVHMCNNIG